MYKNVIVRRPCKAMVEGISAPELGTPDYKKLLAQHDAYISALKQCDVVVTILEADEDFPDSCFIEDTAVITKNCAIICNPNTQSRKKEAAIIRPTIQKFFPEDQIELIRSPGTLDGGDVMMVGDHFYVGRSASTNEEGIRQFIEILEKRGLSGSEIPLKHASHLKTGVSYIENNNLLVSGEFENKLEFLKFNLIEIPEEEAYASNCIWINDKVIVPAGYPTAEQLIRDAGYDVLLVDTSEFKKLDGGLSRLSLRF